MPRTKKIGAVNTEITRNITKPLIEVSTDSEVSQELKVVEVDNELKIKSIDIAQQLGIDHGNLIETIAKYESEIRAFGGFKFETETLPTKGGMQKTKVCYFNEDQSLFVGTLSRNTDQVVKFKMVLVKAFSEARKQNQKNLPNNFVEALEQLLESTKQLEAQKEKVEFANALLDTTNALDFAIASKAMHLPYGRNILFSKCREIGVLDRKNQPYQSFVDQGYFVVLETSFVHPKTGDNMLTTKTLITAKGQKFLLKKLGVYA